MNKLFKQFWAYFCFSMVLIGIIGLSWNAFREQGWVEHLLGVAWEAEILHPILATPIIAGTILLVVLFMRGGLETGKINWYDSVFIYLLMLCGTYFSFKFFYSATIPF